MRTTNVESLKNELNYHQSLLSIKEYIFDNHKTMNNYELYMGLLKSNPELKQMSYNANRIKMGGVVTLGKVVFPCDKKNDAIEIQKKKIAELKKKIKNSASIQQAKKEEKSKNPYNNHEGFFKQQAREIMANAVATGQIGLIPTLPSYTCTLEKLILEKIGRGISFIGCERDFDTFHKMVNTIAENPTLKRTIVPRFGEIGEVIFNAKTDDFAHLILDYCGTINSFHKEIEYAIQNDLVKVNGSLCITLSKNGFSNNIGIVGELLRQFPDGCFTGDKETEMGVKLFLNKVMKSNYRVETFFNYYDSSPMMLIVVRRIA